jgi:CxxC motif-containing protein (DUF1111 family)
MEFYLLNYFKPATYEQTPGVITGRQKFQDIGCSQCHIPDLQIDRDRRVADLETVYGLREWYLQQSVRDCQPALHARRRWKWLPDSEASRAALVPCQEHIH